MSHQEEEFMKRFIDGQELSAGLEQEFFKHYESSIFKALKIKRFSRVINKAFFKRYK